MYKVLDKACKGLAKAVEDFANCTTERQEKKQVEIMRPVIYPNYAYSNDNYINPILENKLIRHAFRTIAIKYYSKQLEEIIQNDTKLTSTNFPKLWANCQYCYSLLGISNPPEVYITSKLCGINALSAEMKGKQIVMLSFQSTVMLNDLEQRFVIGHELGHIQLGHLSAHTIQGLLQDLNKRAELLGPIVNDMVDVPLNRWYRTSEFSADRAGYLCCMDIETINKLFNRLKTNIPTNSYNQYKELSDAHPRLNKRLEVLQKFINS